MRHHKALVWSQQDAHPLYKKIMENLGATDASPQGVGLVATRCPSAVQENHGKSGGNRCVTTRRWFGRNKMPIRCTRKSCPLHRHPSRRPSGKLQLADAVQTAR